MLYILYVSRTVSQQQIRVDFLIGRKLWETKKNPLIIAHKRIYFPNSVFLPSATTVHDV